MVEISEKDPHTFNPKDDGAIHWPTVLQLIFSIISIILLWGLSIILGALVIGSEFSLSNSGVTADNLPLLLITTGLFLAGLLLFPSAGYAFYRIVKRPIPFKFRLPQSHWLFITIVLLLSIGYLVSNIPTLIWIALPPIHVLILGFTALWVISLGIRHLHTGSKQLMWGVFSVGLLVGPLLSLVTELIVLTTVGAAGINYLARDPEFSRLLNQYTEEFLISPMIPLEGLVESFEPYLLNPVTIGLGLFIVAFLVPLIEELIKPIGVWLLLGRDPTASQGFAAGVISGTAFGLFENIFLSVSSGSDWGVVVLSRIGTSFIHALTSGLTGWALALAWQEKRYLRLGFMYLLAVLIHGVWNGIAVLSVLPELLPESTAFPEVLRYVGIYSPVGSFAILIGCFAMLLIINSFLRRAIMSPVNIDG